MDRAGLEQLAWRTAWASVGRVVARRSTPIRFTIVCPARTGSELLVSLLDSNPSICCDGELFKPPCRFPVALADGFAVRARARLGAEAYGWKLLLTQLRASERRFGGARAWAEREVASGHRIVFLWRRNLLAQVLSLVAARTGGQWHHRDGDSGSFSPFAVDPAEIVGLLEWAEEELAWGRAVVAGLPVLEVVYEDDLMDADRHQRTADRLVTRLGLAPSPVSSRLLRRAPPRLLDRVANAEELVLAVTVTRFSRFLDPPMADPAPPAAGSCRQE